MKINNITLEACMGTWLFSLALSIILSTIGLSTSGCAGGTRGTGTPPILPKFGTSGLELQHETKPLLNQIFEDSCEIKLLDKSLSIQISSDSGEVKFIPTQTANCRIAISTLSKQVYLKPSVSSQSLKVKAYVERKLMTDSSRATASETQNLDIVDGKIIFKLSSADPQEIILLTIEYPDPEDVLTLEIIPIYK